MNMTSRDRVLTALNHEEPDRVPLFVGTPGVTTMVLADSGVNSKIGQETLDALARSVSQAVRDGRACEGLLEAMGTVGVLLETHFPITPGDIDELPNEVIPG